VRLGEPAVRDAWLELVRAPFASLASGAAPSAPVALDDALGRGATLAAPALAAVVVVGVVTSGLQVGPMFATRAIAPDAARFGGGGERGLRAGARLAMTLARLGVVLLVATLTLVELLPGIATLARQPIEASLHAVLVVVATMLLRVGLALLGLGTIDAVIERTLYFRSLRMSRREVERERRESEGDPHLVRERARARDEIARWAVSIDLSESRLVITDGDALAVALHYTAEGAAEGDAGSADPDAVPIVSLVLRGTQTAALADEAPRVPRLDDGELAARLALVAPGQPIPAALYDDVARAMHRAGAV
jgi:flagellar biosynthesis protein FlhB